MSPPKNLPAHRRTPSLLSYPLPTSTPNLTSVPAQDDPLPSSSFFDLVIIGAGPAGLAVVTRILETRPAALYTEEEHHHLHWLRKKEGNAPKGTQRLGVLKTKASGRGAERVLVGRKDIGGDNDTTDETCGCPGEMKILVIDKVGKGWMAHWDRMFAALEIKREYLQRGRPRIYSASEGISLTMTTLYARPSDLRSPLFFHPCPADLDSLLAYAQRVGRTKSANATYITNAAVAAFAAAATTKKSASPLDSLCKHTGSRGRDRQIKRLGCCAGLDDTEQGDGNSSDKSSPRPAGSNSNEPDLIEIPGVVGAEQSKHKKRQRNTNGHGGPGRIIGATATAINERERKDYFTPSTRLFHDFISEDVVKRYGLERTEKDWPEAAKVLGQDDEDVEEATPMPATTTPAKTTSTTTTPLVVKGEVSSMQWRDELLVTGWDSPLEGFLIQTTDGAKVGAKAVVSAVGPAGQPSIPAALKAASAQESRPKKVSPRVARANAAAANGVAPQVAPTPAPTTPLHGPGWQHSASLSFLPFPRAHHHTTPTPNSTLLVIGGGLTSAQVCDVALRRNHFSRVVLIMRGHLKVKPFDVGLEWMGRYANLKKMQFWQEDDVPTRLGMLREARQGGSMTQPYAKLLRRYEDEGRLEVLTHSELATASYSEEEKMWDLEIKRTAPLDKRQRAKLAYEEAKRDAQKAAAEAESVGNEEEEGCDCKTGPTATGSGDDTTRITTRRLAATYIISASAFTPDFSSLPFMRDVARQHPVRQEGGLPVLTDDLQWGQLPLFVVGMYSGLQVSC